MARPTTIRVDAADIQGEGAYLEWRRLTWGERRQAREKVFTLTGEEQTALMVDLVGSHIESWNLTDGEGKPLPVPKTVEGLDRLYVEEVDFIFGVVIRAIKGELELAPDDLKN